MPGAVRDLVVAGTAILKVNHPNELVVGVKDG